MCVLLTNSAMNINTRAHVHPTCVRERKKQKCEPAQCHDVPVDVFGKIADFLDQTDVQMCISSHPTETSSIIKKKSTIHYRNCSVIDWKKPYVEAVNDANYFRFTNEDWRELCKLPYKDRGMQNMSENNDFNVVFKNMHCVGCFMPLPMSQNIAEQGADVDSMDAPIDISRSRKPTIMAQSS